MNVVIDTLFTLFYMKAALPGYDSFTANTALFRLISEDTILYSNKLLNQLLCTYSTVHLQFSSFVCKMCPIKNNTYFSIATTSNGFV